MIVEVKVPQLSESVAEATLLEWHKKPGDPVSRDENLIEIETDKVVMELPSPSDGVLVEIVKDARSAVTSGEVIARIDTEAKAAAAAKPAAAAPAPSAAAAPAPAAPAGERMPPPVMPAARKLAEEKGLDASKIQGSGRDGRVTKADVLAHVGRAGSYAVAPEAPPAVPMTPAAAR
ncbi:MAG TPA: biotin/lipoyl-containing protein, partial [Burkholderiales bacterium]|nr:biotin/lipoyl-containing protein [Burkholderiales bacterium]